MDIIAREQLLLNTFGWWQFSVCLFSFVALMSIWWHIGRRQSDKGQVWLAVSVLCWSLSGLVEVYYSHLLGSDNSIANIKSDMGSLKSILSLCNSFFILMALPYFRYLPNKLSSVIESDFWKFIVGIPFLLACLPILSKYIFGRQYNFINDLDVYYSILTLLFLGAVLWESFERRQLKLLSILSVVCIIITFVAQLYKPLDNILNQLLFSAIFKTCLIMIFFALALSWVKEILEESVKYIDFNPDSKKVKIKIANRKVTISEIWPGMEHSFTLTDNQHKLLALYLERKLDGDKILTIKPDNSRDENKYDIQDHKEISRLVKAILKGIFKDKRLDEQLNKGDDAILRKCLIETVSWKTKLILKELSPNTLDLNNHRD